MKVQDLIDLLKEASPEAAVLAYDADSGRVVEITGMVYDSGFVELQTDQN